MCQRLTLRKVLLFLSGSLASLIGMSALWFRVKTLGLENDVLQDGGFGHASISCTSREVWVWDQLYGLSVIPWWWSPSKNSGHGAWSELPCLQVLTLSTSVLGTQSCPWHPGKTNQSSMFHISLTYMPFPGQFFYLYLLKSCNPLDIYQEKIILCKTGTSVFLASSGLPWWLRW